MYPRTNYEMTKEDFSELLDSCKPTPCIMIGGYTPASPQENANNAWRKLGKKMGFDYGTVRLIPGKGFEFFSAIPSETEIQREERLEREAKVKKNERKSILKSEIKERELELAELDK